MARKGKRTAIAAVVLGTGVLSAGLITARDRAEEWWWIWKLRSQEPMERWEAARRLVALGSLRSVPYLIRAVREDEGEAVRSTRVQIEGWGTCGNDFRRHRTATPKVFLLWEMGEGAVPCLRKALDIETDPRTRGILSELLDRSKALRPQRR